MLAKVIYELTGVSKYDFINDNGERVSGCKINYNLATDSENVKGVKPITVSVDMKYFDQFAGCKFPVRANITLDVSDLSRRPSITNIEVIR